MTAKAGDKKEESNDGENGIFVFFDCKLGESFDFSLGISLSKNRRKIRWLNFFNLHKYTEDISEKVCDEIEQSSMVLAK